MTKPITDIIFDFGGVLIDWNPRYLYAGMFDNADEMEYFLLEICTSEWNDHLDRGRSFESATLELCNEYPEYATPIRAYHHRWIEMIGGLIPGTAETLEKLYETGRYTLYGLTNWSAETLPLVKERYSFFSRLKGIVVSGEEGLSKPDPAIYRLLLSRFGLNPQQTLFIDDNVKNIEAASQQGIQTIQFTTNEQLVLKLSAAGLL